MIPGAGKKAGHHKLSLMNSHGNLLGRNAALTCAALPQLGDDPTKEDVKAFTEKTLSSGKVNRSPRCHSTCVTCLLDLIEVKRLGSCSRCKAYLQACSCLASSARLHL